MRSLPLILPVILNLVMGLAFVEGLENEDVHLVVEELASMANIHRTLDLVTGEDPNTDASLAKVENGPANLFLELVLDGS